jgi:hypothetical protein
VTIVEYGDFQCPFCAAFHASMLQLSRERQFRWVYRHFPLTALHGSALEAAEAAECAADSKGWCPCRPWNGSFTEPGRIAEAPAILPARRRSKAGGSYRVLARDFVAGGFGLEDGCAAAGSDSSGAYSVSAGVSFAADSLATVIASIRTRSFDGSRTDVAPLGTSSA